MKRTRKSSSSAAETLMCPKASFMSRHTGHGTKKKRSWMPTISMGPEDKAYAVSFAVPTDAEGILMIIGRQSCDTRKLEGSQIDVGNSEFGGTEALVIFDNVFIPNDRIFLNGEYEYAGLLVERFAGYHRQSYGGCKVGVGDEFVARETVCFSIWLHMCGFYRFSP